MRFESLLALIIAYQLIVFSAGYSIPFHLLRRPTCCRVNRKFSRFSPYRLCSVTKAISMSSDNLENCTDCDRQPLDQFQPLTETESLSLFDAHCHLQLSDDDAGIDSLLSTHHVALMATKPDDWERTLRICERHPKR